MAATRRAIRRQAAQARDAGRDEVELLLPASDDLVEIVREYLASLDEADAYCRAARLLTMEAPPQHRILRRWMASELLRVWRAPDGRPTTVRPFRDRVLDELGVLAAVQRSAARSARLQQVAAGLIDARTPEQVAEVVLREGTAALGAARGTLLRVDGDVLRLAGSLGMSEQALSHTDFMRIDQAFPTAEAVRSGQPIWVETLAERERRYPAMAEADPASRSVVALPLLVGDRPLGALRFGFDNDLVVDDDERDFVRGLAAQAASALDKTLVHAAERRARRDAEQAAGRLERLQAVSTALSRAVDVSAVAEVVLASARDELDVPVGTLCLLDAAVTPDALDGDAPVRLVHWLGLSPEVAARWSRFRLGDPLPVCEAVHGGRPVVVPDRADARLRYPAMTELTADDDTLGAEHALVVLPLLVGEQRLGALSFSVVAPGGVDAREIAFLAALADGCALAVDRCAAVRNLELAGRRLAFLAQASMELASSLDHARTLGRVADLAVPVLADWCIVAVAEDGVLHTLAVGHTDPAKAALARELQDRHTILANSATGRVFRSGRAELYAELDDATLQAGTVDAEHRRQLENLGPLRSVMVVPMAARGRTLGVLTLVSSSDERRFGPDDLALAEDLGRRAGLAIDNAALFSAAQTDRPLTDSSSTPDGSGGASR